MSYRRTEPENDLSGLALEVIFLKNKKALLIGLDGVPWSLLNRYLSQGIMPHLKTILDQGFSLHSMNASIPDVSSVSWTSFATGVNPGEHGIYGFMDVQPRTYSLSFPNSRDVKAPPFWEIAGKTNRRTSTLQERYAERLEQPLRSIIFNLPHTYPASQMNGILVSGFVAIDLKKAVFPDSAYTYLQSLNYQIDVEAEKVREDKKAFLKDLFECLQTRKKAILHFFEEESWDVFLACITETDRLHHFFFDGATDDTHPFHDFFVQFYKELDGFIDTLFQRYMKTSRDKGLFMMLSDHGFAPIKKEVYVNPFLYKTGFLDLRVEGQFFEKIGNQTKAFDLDPCRIYLNDKEVYGRGKVGKEERSTLLKEIQEAIRTLRGEGGEEVIDQIYLKEEIYKGPFVDQAPDMVCLPNDGYDLKGGIEKKEVFGRTIFTGMHTWHDAFCILPASTKIFGKPSIEEMAAHILDYFTA
jgi:predicted AlkP superfamily phosphohydrolase/phosphomutase